MNHIKNLFIFFIILSSSFIYAKEAVCASDYIFIAGRSWTYKVFFINPQKDTTDTVTATLKLSKGDSLFHSMYEKWIYDNTSEEAHAVIGQCGKDTVYFIVKPPKEGRFKALNLYISACCSNKMDTINITFKDTSGEETITGKELMDWEFNAIDSKGENLKIHYTPTFARKTVNTLTKLFPECLQITAERRKLKLVEKVKIEDLKAVFYFHDKYGFVRWEYTKPDSSQIIFDLEKVSGF